ncbi:MAG: hypothetical protein KAS32_26990 [Candidatus Peribacteraceae bacterium]|nr:hypothetical protein [Candidatus Peribacteraceae bacterium]
MGISKPTQFKKFKKRKNKREDVVEDKKEEIKIEFWQKEPYSTLLYHFSIGFGCLITWIGFGGSLKLIIFKFLGLCFSSYFFFEELVPTLRGFVKK